MPIFRTSNVQHFCILSPMKFSFLALPAVSLLPGPKGFVDSCRMYVALMKLLTVVPRK